MLSPDESAATSRLNSLASGSTRVSRRHGHNWPRALAKYAVRYPEAVRSLAEDEEHLLTFYAFPQTMHRHIQTTNAIASLFSNVRQRTDQIDALYFGDQLSHHCLGDDPGYPFAQTLGGMRFEH